MGDLRPRSQRGQRKRRLTTLRRVPAIVIPYRGDAKRRLPSSLRAAVAVAMLGDVVEVAAQVGRVLVVTDDASVVPGDAEIVLDPGEGLGRAVAAGLAAVCEHALVVNADLPAATPAALHRLAAAGLALVEGADGTTNALSLPDPGVYAALYGPGSAERFRAHAGFATVRIPELELDVDSDADLERLDARIGPRTRALLAVPA
jgi:2-phospho-L-lactate guanylyltransferase